MATAMNAAGTLVNPVTAYAVVTTPAATVSGATPDITKNTTAGMPSRLLARAAFTALARVGVGGAVLVTGCLLEAKGCKGFLAEMCFRCGESARRCPLRLWSQPAVRRTVQAAWTPRSRGTGGCGKWCPTARCV